MGRKKKDVRIMSFSIPANLADWLSTQKNKSHVVVSALESIHSQEDTDENEDLKRNYIEARTAFCNLQRERDGMELKIEEAKARFNFWKTQMKNNGIKFAMEDS